MVKVAKPWWDHPTWAIYRWCRGGCGGVLANAGHLEPELRQMTEGDTGRISDPEFCLECRGLCDRT